MKYKSIKFFMVFILFLLSFTGCLQNTSKNHVPSITIDEKGIFSTLASAVQEASDGDTLRLSAGVFQEDIIINKTLYLIGSDTGESKITCKNPSKESIITITASNCSIENLEILSGNPAKHAISITGSNNYLSNISISHSYYGIYVKNSNNGNIFSSIRITNCTYGIFFRFTENNICDDCHISDILYYGIFFSESPKNIVRNSTILSCAEYGLYIDQGSDETMVKNTSFKQMNYGARIKSVFNCSFEHNLFQFNDCGVILCCGSKNNTFFSNAFINNNIQAVDDYENNWSKNQRGNYWSDYTLRYPHAANDGYIWNKAYMLENSTATDPYPLVNNPLS